MNRLMGSIFIVERSFSDFLCDVQWISIVCRSFSLGVGLSTTAPSPCSPFLLFPCLPRPFALVFLFHFCRPPVFSLSAALLVPPTFSNLLSLTPFSHSSLIHRFRRDNFNGVSMIENGALHVVVLRLIVISSGASSAHRPAHPLCLYVPFPRPSCRIGRWHKSMRRREPTNVANFRSWVFCLETKPRDVGAIWDFH